MTASTPSIFSVSLIALSVPGYSMLPVQLRNRKSLSGISRILSSGLITLASCTRDPSFQVSRTYRLFIVFGDRSQKIRHPRHVKKSLVFLPGLVGNLGPRAQAYSLTDSCYLLA